MKAVLNPLMWAHYSCNHKGICIQYDLSNLIVLSHNNDGQILRMSDVRYRDHKILSAIKRNMKVSAEFGLMN